MKKYKAVMDINVLYSGLYSAKGASYQVLNFVEMRKITLFLSTTLLFEYEEILKRNQKILRLSNNAIEDVLNGICNRAECRKIHFLWRPQLSDAKDDHVLELAIAASGADIITHNVSDFKRAETFGIRIIKPSELLGELK